MELPFDRLEGVQNTIVGYSGEGRWAHLPTGCFGANFTLRGYSGGLSLDQNRLSQAVESAWGETLIRWMDGDSFVTGVSNIRRLSFITHRDKKSWPDKYENNETDALTEKLQQM